MYTTSVGHNKITVTALSFRSASVVVWPLTMLKRGHFSELSISFHTPSFRSRIISFLFLYSSDRGVYVSRRPSRSLDVIFRSPLYKNNNNRLYFERVKTLNSSPMTLMTLCPSKQRQNIDATTNYYKIYHIKKIKYNK